MNLLVDAQIVSIMIATVSVEIGVANSILTNKSAESRRQIELEMRQVEFYTQFFTTT